MNSDLILMILIVILATNHFIIRSDSWHQRIWIYWFCQLLNVSMGSWLLLWGIPEFTGTLTIVNILVGLLFLYHAVQNHMHLQKHLRKMKSQN
jgi:hypothetical protein